MNEFCEWVSIDVAENTHEVSLQLYILHLFAEKRKKNYASFKVSGKKKKQDAFII